MNAKRVRDLIGSELWNATGTGSVTVSGFEAADAAVRKLKTPEEAKDFVQLCALDTDDSSAARIPVIPRYLRTICGRHPVDDRYLIGVFDEYFRDNRWDEVFFLGNRILTFNESPYIIKALAEAYDLKGDEENKVAMWERLIKADHTETDVFYRLAQYYESKGEDQLALNCYRRVILRHINASQFEAVKNAWPKIAALQDDGSYLTRLAQRIAHAMGSSLGVGFLTGVYEQGSSFDINSRILLLKTILDFDNDNSFAAERITELFREKYKDNPRLEFCLANTGLLYNYMNCNIAVQKFEKEIEFVEGAFVWHNTWKLGRIRKIEQDEIYIQFVTRKDLHKMSCDMAFSSLRILPKQHIWVLKAGASPEAIKKRITENMEWALKMLFMSFNGQASLKQIKEELVPSILNDAEWAAWQAAAKKELASNPYFSVSDENASVFIMRDTPMTFEEKQLRLFQREKNFFTRYSVMREFLRQDGDPDSEEFVKMLGYFEDEVRLSGPNALCAFIALDHYRKKLGMSFIHTDTDFATLYGKLDTQAVASIYGNIEDAELRHLFVDYIMDNDPAWQNTLAALLHVNPSMQIVDCIASGPKRRVMQDILAQAVQDSQSDPELALFFFRNYTKEDWKSAKFSEEEILRSKLSLLIFVSGKLAHGVDTQLNKTRQKQLIEDLFTKSAVTGFLSDCDTLQARRVFSYVSNVPELEDSYVIGVKHFILSNRSDADEIINEKEEPVSEERLIPKGFLCTRAMFVAKSAELEHIMNVEIPENSKEIGTARDLGDLRENAEYQYAKDKQKNLNFLMNKLTDEIDMAKIIEPGEVDTDYVEFGTKTTFADNISGRQMVQILFGPWESNPEKSILNFQAPLGQKIYNMKKGENRKFEINGVKYDLTVENIELADFNL